MKQLYICVDVDLTAVDPIFQPCGWIDYLNKMSKYPILYREKRFKERIKEAMMLTDQQKVDTGLFKVSLRKTESVTISDPSNLPDEFLKVKVEPNKAEIKKAIKNGQVVFGAELTEGRSVIVK
jgi:hypothetical protein